VVEKYRRIGIRKCHKFAELLKVESAVLVEERTVSNDLSPALEAHAAVGRAVNGSTGYLNDTGTPLGHVTMTHTLG